MDRFYTYGMEDMEDYVPAKPVSLDSLNDSRIRKDRHYFEAPEGMYKI